MDLESESMRWLTRPAWTSVTIDGDRAVMTPDVFEALDDYSCTLPSGAIINKRWRARHPYVYQTDGSNEWWLGEYAEHQADQENLVSIIWRKIWLRFPDGEVARATNGAIRARQAALVLAR